MKRNYSENLNIAKVIDNKKFWKSVKPPFSKKIKTKDNLKLIEDGITITNERELANNLNNLTITSSILYCHIVILKNFGINLDLNTFPGIP